MPPMFCSVLVNPLIVPCGVRVMPWQQRVVAADHAAVDLGLRVERGDRVVEPDVVVRELEVDARRPRLSCSARGL